MIIRIILIALSWLLLAAHFSRADSNILAILCLLLPFALLIKKQWAHLSLSFITIASSLVWITTTWQIIQQRIELGESWTRMAIILITVAAFNILAGILLLKAKRSFS